MKTFLVSWVNNILGVIPISGMLYDKDCFYHTVYNGWWVMWKVSILMGSIYSTGKGIFVLWLQAIQSTTHCIDRERIFYLKHVSYM